MNTTSYNKARSHYEACCRVLKTHLESCGVCRVAAPLREGGAFYCEIGAAALDEVLRAETLIRIAEQDCCTGFCIDCD